MSRIQQYAAAICYVALTAGVLAVSWWLAVGKSEAAKSEKPAPPATVAKPVKEEDLNTVVLTEAAEGRLGVKLASVVRKPVRRIRTYGGDVTVPVGRSVVVAAPLAGTIRALPAGLPHAALAVSGGWFEAVPGAFPQAGQSVRKGQAMFELYPLLSPEGRTSMAASLVDAGGQVENAQSQVNAAKIALDRARTLFIQDAGSRRNLDEAQAAYDLATKTLDAAVARRSVLVKVIGEIESGNAAPIPIDVPDSGILRNVSALPGQNVPSGAALFEVVDLSTVWVRVPLPVGERDDIDLSASATISNLTTTATQRMQSAKPVAAPPSANPLSSTVDLFYELPNESNRLIPGQRLGVALTLNDRAEHPTVPWSAIVFDIHGGAWVYENTATRTYVRRRVVVRHVVGSDAVLENWTWPGTRIVTEGAQELFGAETGSGK